MTFLNGKKGKESCSILKVKKKKKRKETRREKVEKERESYALVWGEAADTAVPELQ